MQRLLIGCSCGVLLLSGCSSPDTEVAVAPAPAAPPAGVTAPAPVPSSAMPPLPGKPTPAPSSSNSTRSADSSAPADTTTTPSSSESFSISGQSATRIVASAADRIRAASSDFELRSLESDFIGHKLRFASFLESSVPSTEAEKEDYRTADQMVTLMDELAAASRIKRENKGYGVPSSVWESHLISAKTMADVIENPIQKSSTDWQKAFADDRARQERLRQERAR